MLTLAETRHPIRKPDTKRFTSTLRFWPGEAVSTTCLFRGQSAPKPSKNVTTCRPPCLAHKACLGNNLQIAVLVSLLTRGQQEKGHNTKPVSISLETNTSPEGLRPDPPTDPTSTSAGANLGPSPVIRARSSDTPREPVAIDASDAPGAPSSASAPSASLAPWAPWAPGPGTGSADILRSAAEGNQNRSKHCSGIC